MELRRIAVLISGSGTNLQALIDATATRRVPARIVLVLSSRKHAYGLERARRAGIPTAVVCPRDFPSQAACDAEIGRLLEEAGAEIVCLAGYMRVLGAELVRAWEGRMLNIHPSLLPAFPGLKVHERVLEAGVPVTGCTVHFVTPEVDAGPVIVQGVVPVLPGDTPETLRERVLEVEHRAYPRALDLVVRGRARIEGDRVVVRDETPGERLLLHPMLARWSTP